ncbi:tyrosine-type recombinase/integrase [Halorarum halobium]|uniref:tyrosine-type recombinase/integrase n=1 Tax=Halorarum halobium TaxID=3075121 RepID=UPI0028AB0B38|nr:site-specific integrase [Halobaculum sp. XH14]
MSDNSDDDIRDQRRELAAAFEQPVDPLAEAAAVFEETEIDPFELFEAEVLAQRELAPATERHYELVFTEWRDYMARQGRHPACPNVEHVEAFIEWQTAAESEGGKGNVNRTATEKLRKLNHAYRYWQQDATFPHPDGYNPIYLARARVPLPVTKEKEHRRIPIPELREMMEAVPNLRARTLIALQLKLGLRAGEITNMRLCDVHLDDAEATRYLPEVGTHDRLQEYTNVLYVPTRDERDGNKSSRPRLLPLDAELRAVLNRYLLVRPDNGEPWVFLSLKSHTQMTSQGVNEIWKDAFHPEYAETDEHRSLTSHFGRHRFTTYWRVEQDVNRQLVKYMRGDRTGAYENARGMNAYLHAYFEDIEELYRENIYRLEL